MQEDPAKIVQRQLDAYNAHDLEGWLATYSQNARQYEFPDKLLAEGHDAIRERMIVRFQEPNLQAQLSSRVVIGSTVIDHELVARTFPEGPGRVEMVAIYQVTAGLIEAATFIIGNKQLS